MAGNDPERLATEPLAPSAYVLSAPRGDFFGAGAQGRFLGVDVGQPAVPVGRLAVDDVEERLLERGGDRRRGGRRPP